MARYADVNKLIWQVQNNDKYGTITKQVFISLLQNSETEDVAPVAHAHWIANRKDCEYTCSHCGDAWRGDFDLEPYDDHFYHCPNCGAKMDEVVPE